MAGDVAGEDPSPPLPTDAAVTSDAEAATGAVPSAAVAAATGAPSPPEAGGSAASVAGPPSAGSGIPSSPPAAAPLARPAASPAADADEPVLTTAGGGGTTGWWSPCLVDGPVEPSSAFPTPSTAAAAPPTGDGPSLADLGTAAWTRAVVEAAPPSASPSVPDRARGGRLRASGRPSPAAGEVAPGRRMQLTTAPMVERARASALPGHTDPPLPRPLVPTPPLQQVLAQRAPFSAAASTQGGRRGKEEERGGGEGEGEGEEERGRGKARRGGGGGEGERRKQAAPAGDGGHRQAKGNKGFSGR